MWFEEKQKKNSYIIFIFFNRMISKLNIFPSSAENNDTSRPSVENPATLPNSTAAKTHFQERQSYAWPKMRANFPFLLFFFCLFIFIIALWAEAAKQNSLFKEEKKQAFCCTCYAHLSAAEIIAKDWLTNVMCIVFGNVTHGILSRTEKWRLIFTFLYL